MRGYIERQNKSYVNVRFYPTEHSFPVEIIEIGKSGDPYDHLQEFQVFKFEENEIEHWDNNWLWDKDERDVLITFKQIPGLFFLEGSNRAVDGMEYPCENLKRVPDKINIKGIEHLLKPRTVNYFKSKI